MEQPSKGKPSLKKGSTVPDNTIDRNQVLSWLKEDVAWLRKKMRNDNPIKNPIRVRLARASIYGCSVLLSGLKDTELDDLMKEIEKIKEHIGMMGNVKSTSQTRSKLH